MLTVEKFKARLKRPNNPDWLLVGVDSKDEKQLYLLSNDGMNNINCAPIEQYAAEIKTCAREMILLGELFLNKMKNQFAFAMGEVFTATHLNLILTIHTLTPLVKKCISQVSLFVGNVAINYQTKRSEKNSD